MPHRPGGLVGRDDDTGAGRGGAGQPKGCCPRALAEQLLPRAEVHREEEQPVFINEIVIDERMSETAAPVYLQLVAWLLLELGGLSDHVTGQNRGVPPVR